MRSDMNSKRQSKMCTITAPAHTPTHAYMGTLAVSLDILATRIWGMLTGGLMSFPAGE